MGLFGGSTTTTTNESFDSGPSSWQKPYLDQAFNAAQNQYNQQAGTPYYQGPTYAGMTEQQKAQLGQMGQFASTTGLGAAGSMISYGQNLAQYGGQAAGMLDQYTQMLGQDGTAANIANAQRYANDPYLQSQIDAATRDVGRTLREDTLPTIDRQASAGGNLNSSRAGIASGIAQRGAADRVADVSAQMRGDAYQRGLTMSQADRQNQLNGLLSGANAYSGMAADGISAMGAGLNAGYGAYDSIISAGRMEQDDRQGQYDADFAKWSGEDNRAWDLLDRYNGVVGSSSWGSSGTSSSKSKQKTSQGLGSALIGAGLSAASIYTGFGGKK